MNTRPFGNVPCEISEVGLGCWQLGGNDWGAVSEEDAFKVLHTAVESGVTFFDTADVYGNGRSETLIGNFLRESGHRIFVATKLGRGAGMFPDGYTETKVREATEMSLYRLGRGTLDLTQLHCVPFGVLQRGEIFEWLRRLQKEGKIRCFGASVETVEEALFCLEQPGLVSLQIIFNIFRQKPIDTLFTKAAEKGVALIVRLPLASGLLSGKMTAQTTFGPNDHRTYNRNGEAFNVGETFAGLPFEKGVELAGALQTVVPEGWNLTQMALRWILDHEAVTTIIPGARTPEQVRANTAVSDLPPLSPQLHAALAHFYRENVAPHIRGPY